MKLLPQRKTLVGYARKLTRAHSKVQIEILQESYRGRLVQEEREVLDYLAHYKLLQLQASDQLLELAAEAQRVNLPTRGELQQFVMRGMRAQTAVDEVIAKHARGGR